MAIPTWFEFVRPRLATQTLSQASLAYFGQFYPEILSAANAIATEAIASSRRIIVPPECAMPEDVAIGLQLVAALIEQSVLKE